MTSTSLPYAFHILILFLFYLKDDELPLHHRGGLREHPFWLLPPRHRREVRVTATSDQGLHPEEV